MPDTPHLYDRAPVWAQTLACTAVGAWTNHGRYGHDFGRRLAAAIERASWPEEQVLAYRDARLSRIVRLAAETPHYRRIFASLGGEWHDFATPEGLANLPILTKLEVQTHPEEFRPARQPPHTKITHTSGTTGAGLRFLTTREAEQEQWAIWWRYRKRLGIERRMKCGRFSGRTIVPVGYDRPPFWRHNYAERQLFFSSHHMAPDTLGAYVEELRQFQPPWIHGYPSLLAVLASHLVGTGQELGFPLRYVTVGVESLLPSQRQQMLTAFGVEPYQHYGATEAVANMSECPHRRLHVDEDFSLVEFVPTQAGPGVAEIVGTCLTNEATIFLRYATSDTTTFPTAARCDCGGWGRLVKDVEGRLEDYLQLPGGRLLGPFNRVFKDMTSIREAQIQQISPDKLRLLVAPQPTWNAGEEARLRVELTKRMGEATQVDVVLVDSVPRTEAGKLRLVVRTEN
jgi:phenylacetate-CoA ligase